MTNQITITTSPCDALPVITLSHALYGVHDVNMPGVSLKDPDDVRLATEIDLDLYDGVLADLPVVDLRSNMEY